MVTIPAFVIGCVVLGIILELPWPYIILAIIGAGTLLAFV
jgi:hypothetical protein